MLLSTFINTPCKIILQNIHNIFLLFISTTGEFYHFPNYIIIDIPSLFLRVSLPSSVVRLDKGSFSVLSGKNFGPLSRFSFNFRLCDLLRLCLRRAACVVIISTIVTTSTGSGVVVSFGTGSRSLVSVVALTCCCSMSLSLKCICGYLFKFALSIFQNHYNFNYVLICQWSTTLCT